VLGPRRLSAKSCGLSVSRLGVIPAQPVKASKPPSGADRVHEIKHDGYRLIVRRDGPAVRLYSRNAYDRTARLSAIAAAAERTKAKSFKAKSFTIDGEAVMLGPDGLSRFGSCRVRRPPIPRSSMPSNLIDGDDMRNRRFDVKVAPARLLRNTKAVMLQRTHRRRRPYGLRARLQARGGEHRVEEGRRNVSIRLVPRPDKVHNPASIAVQRERSEIWNR
jgi:bifunctional non-homologous end joining protein LigD